MATIPTRLVGEAYTSTHAWDLLCDLVDIDNRMAGQRGETEGAELVREAFEESGLSEVSVTEFDIPGWWRGDCSLTTSGDRTHVFDAPYQVIELPGSPSGTVEAEIVDVGHGLPEDFEECDGDLEGTLVMASSLTPDDHDRWIHRGEKYASAVNAGAAGFLFRNHLDGCLPPTGGIGNDDGPGPIPAIGVSREVGSRLVRYCEDGVDGHLEVECRNEPTQSRNIEAVLGPETDQEILVTAHIDAHDIGEGARDNGVGSVLVSEVGRLLSLMEDDLGTRVRCLVFGAEEVGLYGAYHWVDTHAADRVKCVLNIDGAGCSRTLDMYTHGFDPIGEAFRDVSEELTVPIEIAEGIRPHSDHWPFVQEGIPGAQLRSTADESGRGWGHTHADTIDKLDIRDLRDLAVGITAGVVTLAGTDRTVEHKPVEEIRDATIEQGYETGMRNANNWPFEGV